VKKDRSDYHASIRGANFEKNLRPASSKRVTYALGTRGQEQADRLARALSVYRKGGLSQSALVRTLLDFAESTALESGDAAVKSVYQNTEGAPSPAKKPDPESARIWASICSAIRQS
jgi:hypothetical protein